MSPVISRSGLKFGSVSEGVKSILMIFLSRYSFQMKGGIFHGSVADGDDQIGPVHAAMDVIVQMDARGEEAVGAVVGDDAFPHLGMDDVNACQVDKIE